MSILSKPYKSGVQLLGAYLSALYTNPIRTKALTAGTIAFTGNLTAQILTSPTINEQSLIAFGLFGLIFGGTIPHYFFSGLERIINQESKYAGLKMLLIERLFFMPVYQFFSLYTIARLELSSHAQAMSSALRFFIPVAGDSYKYLTILQFMNMTFVPPMLRVLVNNLIGFFWVIHLARKRTARTQKGKAKKQ